MRGQRGFTLIEMVLVLLLIAGLTWYVTNLMSDARDISLGAAYGQDIAELAHHIQEHYQFTNNYDGITTETVIAAGLVPERMRGANPSTGVVEAITTSWGRQIAVTQQGASPFAHRFRLTVGVPRSVKGCPDAAKLVLHSGPMRVTRAGLATWIMDQNAGNPVTETGIADMIDVMCSPANRTASHSWLIEYE